jgi:hypothetical protein
MSFFGEEARLFSKEYDVVEAMRTAWAADIQRFFEALHPEVEKLLGMRLQTRHSSGYRYWWVRSEFPEVGNATLWGAREYPELIRDQTVLWEAYLDINGQHASEATQAAWSRRVEAGLQDVPGLKVGSGAADSFRPLTLNCRWEKDPVAETAVPIARALQVLHRAVAELGKAG